MEFKSSPNHGVVADSTNCLKVFIKFRLDDHWRNQEKTINLKSREPEAEARLIADL